MSLVSQMNRQQSYLCSVYISITNMSCITYIIYSKCPALYLFIHNTNYMKICFTDSHVLTLIYKPAALQLPSLLSEKEP